MAHILFVNQYYWPDLASTGQHLTDLAEHLAAHGHQVTVLTSRGKYLGGEGQAPGKELRNGVRIVRLRGSGLGQRGGILARVLDYALFHLSVGSRVIFGRGNDVVVTLTTPPMLGLWGGLARKFRGVKFVNYLMDLHPDAEFELGMLKRGSLVGRFLDRVQNFAVRTADSNVVLGPYMAARVRQRGVHASRICEIPVWSSKEDVEPIEHERNPLRKSFGWEGRFVVLYSGNAGLLHCFDELLDAAGMLERSAPDVLFAFIGGGPRRAELERQVAQRGLGNVEFRDYLPREDLKFSLPAADVHFMSLRPEQTGVAVPGKLYGILAAGRPVLFVGARRCESADTINLGGAGLTYGLGDSDGLVQGILRLRDEAGTRHRMGRAARTAFLTTYEREVACERWRGFLEEISGEIVLPPAEELRPAA